MEYGVRLVGGVQPWQILQQDETGHASLSIEGTYALARLSEDVPIVFTRVEDRAVVIRVRIVREDSGEPVIHWKPCAIEPGHSWRVTLHRIPAGGLYRIESIIEYEGWDGLSVTRGDMVHHIGVGDNYLIAGQSNAAGRSKSPVMDAPEPGIHMLRLSGAWDMATHPLTETTNTRYAGNYENHNPGHSPWLHFAKCLKRELNHPIGLVNAAYGGAPLKWWNPEENGALLSNAVSLLSDTHTQVRGVLWFQGEAEGYENAAEDYADRFSALVSSLRAQLNKPHLPVITVQLNRCMEGVTDHLDRQWGMVREAQRSAPKSQPGVFVVPSNDLALYDFIHLASESNLIIGERCARATLCEVYGRSIAYQGCEVVQAVQTDGHKVRLTFAPVHNWLNTFGVDAGQLPFEVEDSRGLHRPIGQEVGQDTLTLSFAEPIGNPAVLHGAWRMNVGGMVPWDCMRMPMLSFYGLPITDDRTAE